ncbi:MAG: class I SAM-dependent methyltransferase [Leptolyngbyaceae cyanobacterium MO_188.B28]|nr:class I SAM-dependent methyltransferase [Leptolyngbyaceae cyanobacterium MO_188.B28]
MISAAEKNWNSATTLYIARKLHSIDQESTSKMAVLDMGCGDGVTIEHLLDYEYDLYGYDFPKREKFLRQRLEPYWGIEFEHRIHFMSNEKVIPFGDNLFDIVYANQVFEHVKFFEKMLSECARVLKPNGILLSNFPLATCPIELHVMIPAAHWLPPGKLRVRYLQLFYALGLGKRDKNTSPLQRAIYRDRYLKDCTYYRFMNEIIAVGEAYFESVELEANDFLQSKLDLLKNSPRTIDHMLFSLINKTARSLRESLLIYLIDAPFCFRTPKKNSHIN